MPSSKHAHKHSTSTTRSLVSSRSAPKTEVIINVYDLLPPGNLSQTLWWMGVGLYHSGVVVNNQELAYAGHNRRGLTGVYKTSPGQVPPGARHRVEILHGFTFKSAAEIDAIILELSEQFIGTSYNLLSRNCNHFTSALCKALTSKSAPAWLNRAAGIGVRLPCIVPQEWVVPPDAETADGELVDTDAVDHSGDDDGDDSSSDERSGMIETERRRQQQQRQKQVTSHSKSVVAKGDTGRDLPAAERAPL